MKLYCANDDISFIPFNDELRHEKVDNIAQQGPDLRKLRQLLKVF